MIGDVTWLYSYDVPSKSQDKVLVYEDENTLVSSLQIIKKKTIAVFFKSSEMCGVMYWTHRRSQS